MSTIESKDKSAKNGLQIVLRSALMKDAPALVKLNKEIIKEGPFMLHEPDEYKGTIMKERSTIRNYTENPSRLYLIAEVKGKAAGYLTFINGGLRRTKHLGYIGIFLGKKFRDIGIGRMLMNELIDWGKKNTDIMKLSLSVFSSNPRAIALYKKVGFRLEGRRRRDMIIEGKFVDSILMYKYV